MGYTHRWTYTPQPDAQPAWNAAIADCQTLIDAWRAAHTVSGTGSRVGASTKGDVLSIYGKRESFHMPMQLWMLDAGDGGYCKTYRYGYDTLIVACLAVLAETGCIEVNSDGDSDDWIMGVTYASQALNRPVANPLAPVVAPEPPVVASDLSHAELAACRAELAQWERLVDYWRARALAAEALAGVVS